jgi:hypothetical protein
VVVAAGGFVFFAPLVMLVLAPTFFINTAPGRHILLGAANATPNAHLDLTDSQLHYRPEVGFRIDNMRMVRPYEPEAPAIAMERFQVEGLSLESSKPGRPLICRTATLSGITATIHQEWVKAHKGDGKPPELPYPFPQLMVAQEVNILDTSYTVHQLRHGRKTIMQMEGLEAHFQDFEWDLKRMALHGSGPLKAHHLNMEGMHFYNLDFPVFEADGEYLRIPEGHMDGMGGKVTIRGMLELKGGAPAPNFDLSVRGMELAKLISSGPGGNTGEPTPTGRLSLEGRVSSSTPAVEGDLPDPIVQGKLTIEEFSLPVKVPNKVAEKVVQRMPGYTPGEQPRMNLGTLKGKVRVANDTVHLDRLQMEVAGHGIILDGTIDQRSNALNLKMWLADPNANLDDLDAADQADDERDGLRAALQDKKESLEASQDARQEARGEKAEDLKEKLDGKAADLKAKVEEKRGDRADTPAPVEASPAGTLDSAPAAAQTPEASPVPTKAAAMKSRADQKARSLKDDLDAKKAEVDAAVAAKKAEVDAAVAAKKAEVDAAVAAKKAEIDTAVAAKKAEVDTAVAAKKAEVDTAVAAKKAEIDSHLASLKHSAREDAKTRKARHDARRDEAKAEFETRFGGIHEKLEERRQAMLDALQGRFGRPTLCITGTTASPVINLCEEPSAP